MDVLLTVRVEFCASHRLALPELTLAQNSEIYGKCARPHGHGHNYWLAVTVRGQIDPRTGMAVDLDRLHALVKDWVDAELDHLYLNLDIPYFAEVVPTAENIAVYICDRLRDPIRDLGVDLYKIQLDETDNNACEVYASTLDASTRDAESPRAAWVQEVSR